MIANHCVDYFKNSKTFLGNIFYSANIKIRHYKPKKEMFFEGKRYILKTAGNNFELKQALSLRYTIFKKEMLSKKGYFKIDIDKFDRHCDHLIIIDKENYKIIGTYRLNVDMGKVYAKEEFILKNILNLEGKKLELGRACILKEYRNGLIIGLLWKGIKNYVDNNNIRYLFGCSSVFTSEIKEALGYYKYFKKNNMVPENLEVSPTRKYKYKNCKEIYRKYYKLLPLINENDMPAILRAYIRFGAKICGLPAFDKEFNCFDFFTLLDYNGINFKQVNKFDTL